MTHPYDPGKDPSWPQPGYDPKGYAPDQPTPGYPISGQPAPGYPAPGYPAAGQPAPGYPTSGQPAPGYPAAYPGYGYGPPVPTNALAIASLVCAIAGVATCITAPIGAILGHVARRQIRERGEGGDGLALAGIIVGWILTGLLALLIAFYVVVVVLAIAEGSSGP